MTVFTGIPGIPPKLPWPASAGWHEPGPPGLAIILD